MFTLHSSSHGEADDDAGFGDDYEKINYTDDKDKE